MSSACPVTDIAFSGDTVLLRQDTAHTHTVCLGVCERETDVGRCGPSLGAKISFQPRLQILAQFKKSRRHNMCHRILLWAGLALAGSLTCLPNATEELDRKELVNFVSGQSYAIGLWRNGNYPAARLTARVVQIIIQET